MFRTLIEWDRNLFLLINGHHSPFFDSVFSVFSATWMWIPLFIYLLWLLWQTYGIKKTAYILLFTALLIAISDRTTVMLFKDVFQRPRPCHSSALAGLVHLIDGNCGGQFGFISSHACNHFALVTFLFPFFYKKYRWLAFALILWAAMVAYSRVYLGVHYPADVTVGALVGIIIGVLVSLLFRWFEVRKLPQPKGR